MPFDVRYWRTSGQVEVDFVIDCKHHVIPVECKYATRPDRHQLAHLHRFLEREPRAPLGVVIYRGDFRYDAATRVIYFPVWAMV
ncbi:MAG: DUF4143 domain-containing protein [Deltaproteobacteria bacterium]|nr:DUF4143 domain-containing protein [Deltaproteobacteria bacterium]